jgi:hypothetical protein
MNSEQYKQRRADLLAAREIAEKAQAEGRELTTGEADHVGAALTEARSINQRLDADAKTQQTFAAMDAMARGDTVFHGGVPAPAGHGLRDNGERLAFGETMAAALAAKIMGPSALGAKALSPSGVAVVGQEFEPRPVALGQSADTLLSVLPVKRHATHEFSC